MIRTSDLADGIETVRARWLLTGSGGYFWPAWVLAGWGVGLLLHADETFLHRPSAKPMSMPRFADTADTADLNAPVRGAGRPLAHRATVPVALTSACTHRAREDHRPRRTGCWRVTPRFSRVEISPVLDRVPFGVGRVTCTPPDALGHGSDQTTTAVSTCRRRPHRTVRTEHPREACPQHVLNRRGGRSP